jgi:hypothetical protein
MPKVLVFAGGAPVVRDMTIEEMTAEQRLEVERDTMVVTRFQARAALMGADLLDATDALVAGADELTKLAWADAGTFERRSPAIASLGAQLGLTDTQIDDLFRAAALIHA